jgi:hypothetical protein
MFHTLLSGVLLVGMDGFYIKALKWVFGYEAGWESYKVQRFKESILPG